MHRPHVPQRLHHFEEVIRENLDWGRPEQVQLIFHRKMKRSTVADGRCRTRIITEGVISWWPGVTLMVDPDAPEVSIRYLPGAGSPRDAMTGSPWSAQVIDSSRNDSFWRTDKSKEVKATHNPSFHEAYGVLTPPHQCTIIAS